MSATLEVGTIADSRQKVTLPLELATEAQAILGQRGRGKTNTAVVIVEEMFGAGLPVVVVDTVGVWWGLRSSSNGKKPGLDVVVFGGEHGDVPLEETAGKLLARVIQEQRFSCVIDTSSLPSKAAQRRFLLDFVTALYQGAAKDRRPLHVVFDEADELAPQRTSPEGAKLLGAMEDFVRRGRARGLGCTLVTQRPAVLNKDVLTQIEVLWALGMTGPRDVAAIDEWTRANATDEQAREVKSTLASLPRGTAWLWSPQFLNLFERVAVRRRLTFDSSATPKIGEQRVEPVERAQVDLAALGAEIVATAERVKADDPNTLRARIVDLERQIATKPQAERVEVPAIPDETVQTLVNQANLLHQAVLDLMRVAIGDISETADKVLAAAGPAHQTSAARAPLVARQSGPTTPRESGRATVRADRMGEDRAARAADTPPRFRAGAQRMLESLGRMAPLRLTKGQWGMVSGLKTSGGTWSTYLGELRRAGLIDENPAGFTLTDMGFDLIGGRPAPMTGGELQDHYRRILRAGAVRMLDTLLDAYPVWVSREHLSVLTGISATGGTFSTYLGELIRNGLADRSDQGYRATDLLVMGANA